MARECPPSAIECSIALGQTGSEWFAQNLSHVNDGACAVLDELVHHVDEPVVLVQLVPDILSASGATLPGWVYLLTGSRGGREKLFDL